jgi:hypothetical protein
MNISILLLVSLRGATDLWFIPKHHPFHDSFSALQLDCSYFAVRFSMALISSSFIYLIRIYLKVFVKSFMTLECNNGLTDVLDDPERREISRRERVNEYFRKMMSTLGKFPVLSMRDTFCRRGDSRRVRYN